MKLHDYVRLARLNVALLVVLTLLGCAAGLAFSLLQTPRYQSTVKLYVSTQQASNLSDLSAGDAYAQQVVRSYADIVTTSLVLAPVVRSERLDRTPASLAEDVQASTPIDTVLLDVTVTDDSPVTAAGIANAVAKSLSNAVSTLTPPTADSVTPVRITTVEPATAPTSPSVPNTRLNALIGLVVGLLVAVFIVLLRAALSQRGEQGAKDGADAEPAAEKGGEPAASGEPEYDGVDAIDLVEVGVDEDRAPPRRARRAAR